MAHVRIPFGLRKDYQQVRSSAVRDPTTGCLLVHPVRPSTNPNVFHFRGLIYVLTRVVWAEERGDAGLQTQEVIHVARCPNAGGCCERTNAYGPVCIEPTHLVLGDIFDRTRHHLERQSYKGATA